MEIIMSIGILAVVSIFVMQMYVMARNLEDKAFDKDHALAAAQTVIEDFKLQGETAAQLLESEYIRTMGKGKDVTDSQQTGYKLEFYFDSVWEPVLLQSDDGYTLILEANSDQIQTGWGQLINAKVTVIRHHPYLLEHRNNIELCVLEASGYFPNNTAERGSNTNVSN